MNEESRKLPGAGGRALATQSRGAVAAARPGGLVPLGDGEVGGAGEGRFNVNDMLRIVAKWRWLILGTVLACVLGAVVLSLLMTPKYRADVTLEIKREPVQILGAGSTDAQPVSAAETDFIATQVGLLQSRSLAERVARSLNLASNPSVVDQELPRPTREAVAAGVVRGNFEVEPERGSRLVRLSYTSPDRAVAARVVDAFADNFINSNLERSLEANNYARRFLERRIAQTKERLEQSERQLVDYATRQGIILLGGNAEGGGGQGGGEQSLDASSLVQLNQALSQARTDRIAAEQRYRNAQAAASASVVNNSTVQGLTSQRAVLEAEYQQKLSQFQPEYPEMQALKARIDSLSRAIANQSSQAAGASSGSLRADYLAAAARERELQGRVNGLKGDVLDLRRRSIQYNILQREVDTTRAQYDALLQRYKEIGVVGGIGTNLVSIVDRAEVPGAPVSPNLPLNVIAGLILGLLLGFGAAFAIEFVDDTIKTPDDLTNKLGLTPLGLIPRGPKDTPLLEVLGDPRAPVTEAYQSVRAALQFASDHGVPKSLLVTSTRAAEGKSSTSMALAQSFARLGASVLLVDGDLRKPTFRAPSGRTEGLSNLLAGSDNVRDCVHETSIERLSLLPSGPIPPNPAELLATDRFGRILGELAGRFDIIVVDAPPVLGLADAPLLGSVCEATIMVYEAGKTRRGAALNAVSRMRTADAHLVGGILTKFNARSSGYGYGYGYGDEAYAYGIGNEGQRQIELVS